MQDLVNRIGMTLQFVSLWLVTPQILGEQICSPLRDGCAGSLTEQWTKSGSSRSTIVVTLWTLAVGSFLVATLRYFACVGLYIKYFRMVIGIRYLDYVVAIPVLIFLSAVAAFFIALAAFFVAFVAQKLIERAAGSTRRLLGTGAMLFTIGFAALMWATWLPR